MRVHVDRHCFCDATGTRIVCTIDPEDAEPDVSMPRFFIRTTSPRGRCATTLVASAGAGAGADAGRLRGVKCGHGARHEAGNKYQTFASICLVVVKNRFWWFFVFFLCFAWLPLKVRTQRSANDHVCFFRPSQKKKNVFGERTHTHASWWVGGMLTIRPLKPRVYLALSRECAEGNGYRSMEEKF